MQSQYHQFHEATWIMLSTSPKLEDITFDNEADPYVLCDLLNRGYSTTALPGTAPCRRLSNLSLEWNQLEKDSRLRQIVVSALNNRPRSCRVKTMTVLRSGIESPEAGSDHYDFAAAMPDVQIIWQK